MSPQMVGGGAQSGTTRRLRGTPDKQPAADTMKLGEMLGANSVRQFAGRDEASIFAEEADQGSHVVVLGTEAAEEGKVKDVVTPLPAHEGGTKEVDGLWRHVEEDLEDDVVRQEHRQ